MSLKTGIDGLPLYFLSSVAALALPLAALSSDNIQTYRIPKESAVAPKTTNAETPKPKPLSWTLPEGWQEAPASSVRVASFLVPGKDGTIAQLSVMPFPGMVGGELANINRWRREVGLNEITEDAIVSQPVQVGTNSAKLYEIVGEKDATSVAWLVRDENSWFFKLRGDKSAVLDAKPAFIAFLKSIKFVAAPSMDAANAVADNPMGNPHDSALPMGHPAIGTTELPSGHPTIGASDTNKPTAAPAPAAKAPKMPALQIPASWKEQPASWMVLKSYTVGEDPAKAGITITSFPGDVGGLLANVNRWRAQLGLSEITENDLPKVSQTIDTKNGKVTLVQMDATSKPMRLVGLIVPHGEGSAKETWFYKMVGDPTVVDHEKENIVNVVKSAQYP